MIFDTLKTQIADNVACRSQEILALAFELANKPVEDADKPGLLRQFESLTRDYFVAKSSLRRMNKYFAHLYTSEQVESQKREVAENRRTKNEFRLTLVQRGWHKEVQDTEFRLARVWMTISHRSQPKIFSATDHSVASLENPLTRGIDAMKSIMSSTYKTTLINVEPGA